MNEEIKYHHYSSLAIEMYIKNKEIEARLASGTAFLVSSNSGSSYLITNRHNVSGKDAQGRFLSEKGAVPNMIKVYYRSAKNVNEVITKDYFLYDGEDFVTENRVWHEHPILREKMDCVALEVKNLNGIHLFHQKFGTNIVNEKNITDTVSVIGYPFDLKDANFGPIWATGFIATDPNLNFEYEPKFLIDCRSRQGQSGSPVVSYKKYDIENISESGFSLVKGGDISSFLGIYSGRINKESDLGIVWKASAIKELVESIKC